MKNFQVLKVVLDLLTLTNSAIL